MGGGGTPEKWFLRQNPAAGKAFPRNDKTALVLTVTGGGRGELLGWPYCLRPRRRRSLAKKWYLNPSTVGPTERKDMDRMFTL